MQSRVNVNRLFIRASSSGSRRDLGFEDRCVGKWTEFTIEIIAFDFFASRSLLSKSNNSFCAQFLLINFVFKNTYFKNREMKIINVNENFTCETTTPILYTQFLERLKILFNRDLEKIYFLISFCYVRF